MEQVEELATTLLSYLVEQMGGIVELSREQLVAHVNGDMKFIKMSVEADKLILENVETNVEN